MSLKMVEADGTLVPAPRNLPTELFLDFDRRDEAQIEAELLGGVVAEYAYRFDQGAGAVTGLSLAGVMAVAQHMGGITCDEPPHWEIGEDEYYCEIAATDHGRGLKLWGNASQPKYLRRRDGQQILDPHARAKALSKAQRNAVRKLIPETLATKMLEAYLAGQQPQARRPIARPRKRAEDVVDPPHVEEIPLRPDEPTGFDYNVDAHLREIVSELRHPITARRLAAVEDEVTRYGFDADPEVSTLLAAAKARRGTQAQPAKA
jgi:hypothetical protein